MYKQGLRKYELEKKNGFIFFYFQFWFTQFLFTRTYIFLQLSWPQFLYCHVNVRVTKNDITQIFYNKLNTNYIGISVQFQAQLRQQIITIIKIPSSKFSANVQFNSICSLLKGNGHRMLEAFTRQRTLLPSPYAKHFKSKFTVN